MDLKKITDEVERITHTCNAVFFAIVAAGLVIFSVYLGFRMAVADDDSKRKEARSQLIYSIIGLMAAVAMMELFRTVLPATTGGIGVQLPSDGIDAKVQRTVSNVLENTRSIIASVMSVLGILISIFAMYLGWQLMKAEDASKRKNAQQQLIWAVVAILGVIALYEVSKTIITTLVTMTK